MDFAGQVAFVTGGSGDIGAAIAKALAASGADVIISYVGDAGRAQATVGAVQQLGRKSAAVQLDQRDQKSIPACVIEVTRTFGRVDILVNNAGWNIGIPFPQLDALTADIWDRLLETNLRGPFLLSQALAPQLRQHKRGRIVNIASSCRIGARRQQHRLCRQQGRSDPPDALSGGRIGSRRERKLCRPGFGRGHAHGRSRPRGNEARRARDDSSRQNRKRRRYRAAGGHVLPGRQRQRTNRRRRWRITARNALSASSQNRSFGHEIGRAFRLFAGGLDGRFAGLFRRSALLAGRANLVKFVIGQMFDSDK